MTDLSVIAEQIAHIAKVANFWCNFALVCGVIGFVLSVACAVYLIRKTEENTDTFQQNLKSKNCTNTINQKIKEEK